MAAAHRGVADQRARLGRGCPVCRLLDEHCRRQQSPTRVAAQIVSGIGFLGAGVILREGLNITGLNTAATLWCSAMVGTFAGAGQLVASAIAAAFALLTNLFLRPLVRLINRQPFGAVEVETRYSVELRCQGQQEAHTRALLLQAAASAGLGPHRLTSENLEDSPQVTVSALLVSPNRHDSALECSSGGSCESTAIA